MKKDLPNSDRLIQKLQNEIKKENEVLSQRAYADHAIDISHLKEKSQEKATPKIGAFVQDRPTLPKDLKISLLLDEARSLFGKDKREQALIRLSEILALDPEHLAALDLKEKIAQKQKKAGEQEKREKVERAHNRALAAERTGDSITATDIARSLLAIDESDAVARGILERGLAQPQKPHKQGMTIDRPPEAKHSMLRPVALLALIVLGGGLVVTLLGTFLFVHRPSSQPAPTPQELTTEIPKSDPAVTEALAQVLNLIEAQKFSEALVATQAILDRFPDHPKAIALKQRAQENLDKIAQGNREAKALYENGKYKEAMDVLEQVLKLSPSDAEVRQLLPQLDRIARTEADAAREKLRQSRSLAEQGGGARFSTATFQAVRDLESEALHLYKAGRFSQATAKFLAAKEAYETVTNEKHNQNVPTVELDRRRTALTARQNYERAFGHASRAGVDKISPDRFQEATRRASQAQAKYGRGDFGGALSDFEAAFVIMRQAETMAETSRAAVEGEMEAARQATEIARRALSQGDLRAAAEEANAEELASQGRKSEAALAYRRAASLYEAAAQKAEANRQGVLDLLGKYKAAIEGKNTEALKGLWPALSGTAEKRIRDTFNNTQSLRVDLHLTALQFSGETATAICERRDEIFTADGQRLRHETNTTLNLRKQSDSWIIEAIH